MSLKSTSRPDFSDTRLFLMRSPLFSANWLKWTSFSSVAVCSFTGTLTRPNEIVPDQIALGMPASYPVTPEDLIDLPPEDFVAARDALAKELKAAGKVAEAAEVKNLRKPTVQTWIADQVRRHHDDAVDALRTASVAVADAQEAAITKGDRDALKAATTTRRDAIRALGKVVDQVLARNGRPTTYKDEVLSDIEAEVTAAVAGGTFGLRDDLPLPARSANKDADADRRAKEKAEKERAKAKAEIDAARARVDRARAALDDAELELAAVLERHGGVERDA